MLEYTTIQLLTLIIALVLPLFGVAVNLGMQARQSKYHQERIDKLEHTTENIMSGGIEGVAIFVSKIECEENREHCRREILGLVVKQSEVMNSHSKCIHALENFVRWFLTCKEGLSLVEANKILNGDK